MGELIECGERTVQTKFRVALTDIAEKHDILPGDTIRVIIQKTDIDDDASYKPDPNLVETMNILNDLLPRITLMRHSLKLIEDPTFHESNKGLEFRSLDFDLKTFEYRMRDALRIFGMDVNLYPAKTELTERTWRGVAAVQPICCDNKQEFEKSINQDVSKKITKELLNIMPFTMLMRHNISSLKSIDEYGEETEEEKLEYKKYMAKNFPVEKYPELAERPLLFGREQEYFSIVEYSNVIEVAIKKILNELGVRIECKPSEHAGEYSDQGILIPCMNEDFNKA